MKRILANTIAIILALSFASVTGASTGAAQTGDEQTIRQLVREWLDALVKNDLAALDRIIADDYVITTSDGSVLNKAQDLAPLKAGLKFESATTEDLKVRIYADAAIVTGVGVFKGSFNGRAFSVRERFTDTWLKRGGRWQAVASQSSSLKN
ncbi:MAG TPA: nuclear transport factor 2 family protein [Blastocatellia bacterium]|nr:nuclear transport factor 2 family protein [Blastocatellia bacterium]